MQLLRRKTVCDRLGGINDVTLWRITRDDPTFPAAVRINMGCCRFRGHQPKLLELFRTVSD